MILETTILFVLACFTNANFIQRPYYNRPLQPQYVPQQPPPPQYYQTRMYPQPYMRAPMPQPRTVPYMPIYSPIQQQAPPQTTQLYKAPIDVVLNGEKCVDRTPHPQNPHQYISCLPDGDYVIMDCPDGLVFNKYLDRCDYNANEVSSCASQPCSHGGRCVDLPDHKYRCECLQGFNGEKCELAPDICAMNPCGPSGECHSMPSNSPVPFYCTCFHDRFYGLSCSRSSVPNPCHLTEATESYFKVKFDPSLFIHCDGTNLHMKFCPKPLVFSTRDNICDWSSHDGQAPQVAQSLQATQPQQSQQRYEPIVAEKIHENNNLY